MKYLKKFRIFENNNINCWEDKENPFKYTESYLNGEFHQSILDIGYCWWQKELVDRYSDMIEKMKDDFGKEFAILILLGKYNQQVGNGGHQQYFDNGYASAGSDGSHSTNAPMALGEPRWAWSSQTPPGRVDRRAWIARTKIADPARSPLPKHWSPKHPGLPA